MPVFMLDSNKHTYVSRIVSKENKGSGYSTGALIANFCTLPWEFIRLGVGIRLFTTFIFLYQIQ